MFCREISFVASYARDEGGGSQKVTNDDEGGGREGVTMPHKIDDVIYEQPLMLHVQVLFKPIPVFAKWV